MRRTIPILAALGPLLLASMTHAQETIRDRSYTDRGVTMPARTLRIDLGAPEYGINDSGFVNGPFGSPYGLRIGRDRVHDGAGTHLSRFTMLGIGVAYGITDRVEIGVNALPLVLDASQFTLGTRAADREGFGNLTAYARFALAHGRRAQVGLQLAASIPTGTDAGLAVGLPINVNARHGLRVETGAELETFFGDDIDGDDSPWLTLDIPVAVSKQLGRRGFAGVRSGVLLHGLTDESDVTIPIGGQGGFSVVGTHAAADFKGTFQYFFLSNDVPGVRTAAWSFGASVNVYVRP